MCMGIQCVLVNSSTDAVIPMCTCTHVVRCVHAHMSPNVRSDYKAVQIAIKTALWKFLLIFYFYCVF